MAEPFGRFEIRTEDRQAEARPLDATDFAAAARLVRTDVVIPFRRFKADRVPQRLGRIRRAEDGTVPSVPFVFHGDGTPPLVAENAQRRVLDPAAEQAERDPHRLATAQGARRIPELHAAAVVLGTENGLLRPAQQFRQGRRTRLERAQRLLFLLIRQTAVAAVHHRWKGRLETEAAVVHQQTQQFRRSQRFGKRKEFVDPCQRHRAAQTLLRRGVDLDRRVEVAADHAVPRRGDDRRAELGVAACGDPALARQPRRNEAAVAVGNEERVVLRPVLVIAATKPDIILCPFLQRQSMHTYSLA